MSTSNFDSKSPVSKKSVSFPNDNAPEFKPQAIMQQTEIGEAKMSSGAKDGYKNKKSSSAWVSPSPSSNRNGGGSRKSCNSLGLNRGQSLESMQFRMPHRSHSITSPLPSSFDTKASTFTPPAPPTPLEIGLQRAQSLGEDMAQFGTLNLGGMSTTRPSLTTRGSVQMHKGALAGVSRPSVSGTPRTSVGAVSRMTIQENNAQVHQELEIPPPEGLKLQTEKAPRTLSSFSSISSGRQSMPRLSEVESSLIQAQIAILNASGSNAFSQTGLSAGDLTKVVGRAVESVTELVTVLGCRTSRSLIKIILENAETDAKAELIARKAIELARNEQLQKDEEEAAKSKSRKSILPIPGTEEIAHSKSPSSSSSTSQCSVAPAIGLVRRSSRKSVCSIPASIARSEGSTSGDDSSQESRNEDSFFKALRANSIKQNGEQIRESILQKEQENQSDNEQDKSNHMDQSQVVAA